MTASLCCRVGRGPSFFWEARDQQWAVVQALKCVAVTLDAHKRDPLTDTGALRMGLRLSFSTGRPGDLYPLHQIATAFLGDWGDRKNGETAERT